jgi:hypothetical protein
MTRQWAFILDMNRDGAVNISDVGLWMKWLFFYPGDLIHSALITLAPGVARLLGLSPESYGGWGAGLLSAYVWFNALPILFLIAAAAKSSSPTPASRNPSGPTIAWARKLPWWAWMAVMISFCVLITHVGKR